MLDFVWNLLSFVLVLGVIVTVHEYGHFWVARKVGVKVLRFSIGFGKPLVRWHDKLGTEYVIAAIPLGGYVKMLDERVETVPQEQRHLAFNNKSVYARIAVVAAGPIANFLFAIIAAMAIYLIGVKSVLPVIGDVEENSLAARANIQAEQTIVRIGDNETYSWRDVLLSLMQEIGNDEVVIEVRDPELGNKYHRLDLSQWRIDDDSESPLKTLGIVPYRPELTLQLAVVGEQTPAQMGGLQVKDIIHLVDGEPVATWQAFVNIVKQSPNKEILLTISRGEEKLNVPVVPTSKVDQQGLSHGFLGVVPYANPWPDEYIVTQQYGVFDAFFLGVDKTWQLISVSFNTVVNLITGQVSVKNLSGPVGVAIGAGNSTSIGFVAILEFLAFVSVSIGFFNLLPLPILDGGHLMYYIIELIRKKPVSEKTQELGFRIGALILVLLTGLALFNDFTRL